MNNFLFIIFGITGDLSKRKIIPALYHLIKKEKIKKVAIIGTALEDKSIEEVFAPAKEFIKDIDEKIWNNLLSITTYCKLDVKKSKDFEKLKKIILEKEKEYQLSGNRLFYCAVASNFFIDITKNLTKFDLLKKMEISHSSKVWNRIVYEKPFGHDFKSAKKINKVITKLLDESQIFRIDHYLVKEIVDNITFVRFTNRVFEPLWNSQHIDSVQIIINEKVCIEDRGSYYDSFGAFKDVVQNHMLQLVALIAMEPPKELIGDYIRDKKAQILKRIFPDTGILGQYIGYQEEPGVRLNSKTETFTALKLYIKDKRWQGVPFFLKTGKCLDKKETKICIKFKNAYCLFSNKCPIDPNYLTISIYPEEGFILELFTKKPNTRNELIKAKMDFCYSCLFPPGAFEAYENIILDIIKGERSISVRQDEIEYSWKAIDKFISMNLTLYKYEKDTNGPIQSKNFAIKNNFEWKY